jgi:hypothetical protein
LDAAGQLSLKFGIFHRSIAPPRGMCYLKMAADGKEIPSSHIFLIKLTGELDALIAAVARSSEDTVVTHNIKDFHNIPNLQLEDWL